LAVSGQPQLAITGHFLLSARTVDMRATNQVKP
jgi:hypothetical protein